MTLTSLMHGAQAVGVVIFVIGGIVLIIRFTRAQRALEAAIDAIEALNEQAAPPEDMA